MSIADEGRAYVAYKKKQIKSNDSILNHLDREVNKALDKLEAVRRERDELASAMDADRLDVATVNGLIHRLEVKRSRFEGEEASDLMEQIKRYTIPKARGVAQLEAGAY